MIIFIELKVYDRKIGILDLCNRYFNEGVGILLLLVFILLIMFWRLVLVGFWLRDFIMVFSFLLLIVLFLFLLNKLNVFLNFMNR